MERMNAWEKYPEGKKRNEVFDFAEEYRKFLSDCKTERECVTYCGKGRKSGIRKSGYRTGEGHEAQSRR